VDLLLSLVIMDIYSRYVVGWMVAHRENSSLAQSLIDIL
jgi:transposase InsO family protein